MKAQFETTSFPKAMHERLEHYVYVYVHTLGTENRIVYVGKGQGNRCFDHLKTVAEDEKTVAIREAYSTGKLRIDILVYGVDELTALKVEAATIDLLGMDGLYNRRRGDGAIEFGRITTDDLISKLGSPKQLSAESFHENCVLIRISNMYQSGMTGLAMYDSTRGVWRATLNECKKTKFALAVGDGIVREVYLIAGWFQGGSTTYSTREASPDDEFWKKRVEFVGRVADDSDRKKYLHKSVSGLWSRGAQNPIRYVGPAFR